MCLPHITSVQSLLGFNFIRIILLRPQEELLPFLRFLLLVLPASRLLPQALLSLLAFHPPLHRSRNALLLRVPLSLLLSSPPLHLRSLLPSPLNHHLLFRRFHLDPIQCRAAISPAISPISNPTLLAHLLVIVLIRLTTLRMISLVASRPLLLVLLLLLGCLVLPLLLLLLPLRCLGCLGSPPLHSAPMLHL